MESSLARPRQQLQGSRKKVTSRPHLPLKLRFARRGRHSDRRLAAPSSFPPPTAAAHHVQAETADTSRAPAAGLAGAVPAAFAQRAGDCPQPRRRHPQPDHPRQLPPRLHREHAVPPGEAQQPCGRHRSRLEGHPPDRQDDGARALAGRHLQLRLHGAQHALLLHRPEEHRRGRPHAQPAAGAADPLLRQHRDAAARDDPDGGRHVRAGLRVAGQEPHDQELPRAGDVPGRVALPRGPLAPPGHRHEHQRGALVARAPRHELRVPGALQPRRRRRQRHPLVQGDGPRRHRGHARALRQHLGARLAARLRRRRRRPRRQAHVPRELVEGHRLEQGRREGVGEPQEHPPLKRGRRVNAETGYRPLLNCPCQKATFGGDVSRIPQRSCAIACNKKNVTCV